MSRFRITIQFVITPNGDTDPKHNYTKLINFIYIKHYYNYILKLAFLVLTKKFKK